MILIICQLGFDLFAAGRARSVLIELKIKASFVLTLNHQRFAARFAVILHKRPVIAVRALYVQWLAAAGAHSVTFLDDTQACWAIKTERTVAAAFGAETRVRFNQLAAVHTRFFIKCH